jgi:hypothetical protein
MRAVPYKPNMVAYSTMLEAVFNLKGGIGYIYRRDLRKGVVKVIHVLQQEGTLV